MKTTAKNFNSVPKDVAESKPNSFFKVKHALRDVLFVAHDLVSDVAED